MEKISITSELWESERGEISLPVLAKRLGGRNLGPENMRRAVKRLGEMFYQNNSKNVAVDNPKLSMESTFYD